MVQQKKTKMKRTRKKKSKKETAGAAVIPCFFAFSDKTI